MKYVIACLLIALVGAMVPYLYAPKRETVVVDNGLIGLNLPAGIDKLGTPMSDNTFRAVDATRPFSEVLRDNHSLRSVRPDDLVRMCQWRRQNRLTIAWFILRNGTWVAVYAIECPVDIVF